jgi:hypothetical protein
LALPRRNAGGIAVERRTAVWALITSVGDPQREAGEKDGDCAPLEGLASMASSGRCFDPDQFSRRIISASSPDSDRTDRRRIPELLKRSPPGSVRCVVVLSTATGIVLDAFDMSPKQPADAGKCVAYDVQHDALTMRGPERSCASDAVRN